MGGRDRSMDNVSIERLWRSLKYEDDYLKGYADGREAAPSIAEWIAARRSLNLTAPVLGFGFAPLAP